MTIEEIQAVIRKFRDERDWMQFHNAKDMTSAIAIEAAELQEIYLWKNGQGIEETSKAKRVQITDEIADIAIYLFELADNLKVNLGQAMLEKIEKNASKYPVDKARGSSAKYTEL